MTSLREKAQAQANAALVRAEAALDQIEQTIMGARATIKFAADLIGAAAESDTRGTLEEFDESEDALKHLVGVASVEFKLFSSAHETLAFHVHELRRMRS